MEAQVYHRGTLCCESEHGITRILRFSCHVPADQTIHSFMTLFHRNVSFQILSRRMSSGCAIVHARDRIGLKQLFDDDSSTYTYLLWDQSTKDAIVIDPVDLQVDRDLKEVQDLGLRLHYGINTHLHAGTYSQDPGK